MNHIAAGMQQKLEHREITALFASPSTFNLCPTCQLENDARSIDTCGSEIRRLPKNSAPVSSMHSTPNSADPLLQRCMQDRDIFTVNLVFCSLVCSDSSRQYPAGRSGFFCSPHVALSQSSSDRAPRGPVDHVKSIGRKINRITPSSYRIGGVHSIDLSRGQ